MPQWNALPSPLVSLSSIFELILSTHHSGGSQKKIPWVNSVERGIFLTLFLTIA